MQYVSIYRMLVKAGHGPQKAAEIVLDAKRGDSHALNWIGVLFKIRHSMKA